MIFTAYLFIQSAYAAGCRAGSIINHRYFLKEPKWMMILGIFVPTKGL